jgi:hypothetical protein
MVDRPRTPYKVYPSGQTIEKKAEFGEVELSTTDTVTFDTHVSKEMLNVVFWKKSDGSQVTNTKALNVATITGAVTNEPCLYMAFGYKP